MIFDFKDADEVKSAWKYLKELHMKGSVVSIDEKYSKISDPQISLIITLQKLYCCEMGERLDDVKFQMENEFFGKNRVKTADGHDVLIARNISDIDKKEASKYISWIYHWAARKNCPLPEVSQIKSNAKHFNSIIAQHREFL